MLTRSRRKDVFDALDELEDDVSAIDDLQTSADESDAPHHDGEAATTDGGETAATSDDPPSTDEDSVVSRRRTTLRRAALILGVGLVIIAVGIAGWLAWQLKVLHDTAAATRAAVSVARDYGVKLTSISSKDVDQNFAQVLDGATGEFKDMYGQSAAQLRQLLVDNDAEAKGTVIDAAIKSATATKVDVLLFIDQSVTNRADPTPRLDRNRVSMTMELVDGRWLASKVDVV